MIRGIVLVLTGAAAGVLIAAEFAPLFTVGAGDLTVRTLRSGDHHGYALAVLAVVALWLAWLGTRPALLGLAAVGLAAIAVVLLVDWPDATATGLVADLRYARAHARVGLYLGLGGALTLVTAAAAGLAPSGPPAPPRPRATPPS